MGACFFCISPQAASDSLVYMSAELSDCGAMDFSVPVDSVAWQGRWDIAPF